MRQKNQTINPVQTEFLDIRKLTEKIASPLEIEDFVIQAMDEVSPPKWHLAHTSWFFEAFVLIPYDIASRGHLSRPAVWERRVRILDLPIATFSIQTNDGSLAGFDWRVTSHDIA